MIHTQELTSVGYHNQLLADFVCLSRKVSYASKKVYPVINVFNPREVRSNSYICYHSILIFGIRVLCLGFSKTSHIDSLDRFRKLVVDKVITKLCKKKNIIKKSVKIQYVN